MFGYLAPPLTSFSTKRWLSRQVGELPLVELESCRLIVLERMPVDCSALGRSLLSPSLTSTPRSLSGNLRSNHSYLSFQGSNLPLQARNQQIRVSLRPCGPFQQCRVAPDSLFSMSESLEDDLLPFLGLIGFLLRQVLKLSSDCGKLSSDCGYQILLLEFQHG